ncbi:NAD(P)-dependent alcohol dehydrogenase [Agromyces aerolatus]|uniref:NAD(P)-dependent alcohol dehydrogenase n=1 Tax=Agromyces sp. LY-1074 TaxID=3074080 RepID=UPI00285A754B|nr:MULTISPECIES: NAD(P)-dependent alcohol dehydrogenase [unclassified Agromyces]MDR5698799.1 NAD(P)-dependent alcohol dehydrogenase [Agromyces sp. LY-1074]MDR5705423.1 NAD(P)-dependent alcohol dehydrogenase [Agromyces sp. LY-1358]
MLAAVVQKYGPPEVVHLAERPTPEPGAGQIRVRVHAASVGPSDCAFRSGTPWFARLFAGPMKPRQQILGSDFAGTVDAVGPGVTRFAPGDRVFGATGAASGAHAEFVVIAADGAVQPIPVRPAGRRVARAGDLGRIAEPAPGGDDADTDTPVEVATAPWSDAEAVSLVDGFLTALPFLRDVCRVRPGQRVLVNGASGAVGSAAVQLARWMGAEVTAVTSTPNLELVRRLGASHTIDYTAERFTEARDAYDVVFDAVGRSSYRRVRRTITSHGVYASTVPSPGLLAAIAWTRIRLGRRAAVAFTGLRADAAKRTDLELLGRLVAEGEFVPVIDRTLPLADIVAAHTRVDSGRKVGALVVSLVE